MLLHSEKLSAKIVYPRNKLMVHHRNHTLRKLLQVTEFLEVVKHLVEEESLKDDSLLKSTRLDILKKVFNS